MVNILLTYNDVNREKEGWIHLDILNNSPEELSFLENIEKSTVDKLVAEHVIDRFTFDKAINNIFSWCSFLNYNGEITLIFNDFEDIVRHYINTQCDIDVINEKFSQRGSLHSLSSIVSVLRSVGLKIVTARNEGPAAVVVARRI